MNLYSFPRRAWILIRPALQTAVSLPLTLSRRHIRCTGTCDSGAGTEPVMAKWCQKWPHLCQFEIKDHFIVWTSTINVLSNLSHLHIYCGPSVRSFSCKWNVSLFIWGFMWRLTVRHTAHVCGIRRAAFWSLFSFSSRCLLLLGFCVIQCHAILLAYSFP